MRTDPRLHRLRHRRRPLDAWVAGEGPAVILLHGWGLSGGVYRAALREIAHRGHRGIAPSVSSLDVPWTLEGVAERVAEIMAGLDAAPAAVVGHSFGGLVAVRLAVDHPDFVRAIIAANSPLISPGNRGLGRLAIPGRHYRVAAHRGSAMALARTLGRRGGLSSLAGAARFLLAGDMTGELEILRDSGLPAAVLWSERDTLLPRRVGEQAAAMLGCEMEIVTRDDPGWKDRRPPDHDWPIRAPALFSERVIRTLRRMEQAAPGPGPP